MTKSRKVETVEVDVFIGRMVQHIMPKGFQRVRYYGLQATKTFKKWSEVIRKGMKALGRGIKGTYQVVKAKRYRERYKEISSQDPFLCRYCGHEMVLWKIWHPKYGVLYDEYENIKTTGTARLQDLTPGRRGLPVRPSSGGNPYRCSHCRHEMKVPPIIDRIAKAEYEGRNVEGFMPILGCPQCNRETMKYAQGRKPAR